VAISTPLYHDEGDDEVFDGVLVLTVNLGDFEFFRTNNARSRDRFAVLVDGRKGDDTGTILQHPLFDHFLREQGRLPEEFLQYRVPEELLEQGSAKIYDDPLARHPLVRELNSGNPYPSEWIAAAASVRTPGAEEGERGSGLVVLVQEDYQRVISPVQQLGRRLVREGLLALLVVIVASGLLWWFVVRLFRDPTAGSRRHVDGTPESTPIHGMTTLAPSRQRK
jgi:hypothetical protein